MKKGNITVSIGITAFNEENTIKNVLESIKNQKASTYKIEKIYISCDGSTDKTPSVVIDFAKRMKIINYKIYRSNKGKLFRLEQIFASARSEILILFDADIVIRDEYLLEKLIREFSNDSVGLVGGNDQPIVNNGFFSKVLKTTIDMWFLTRTLPKYKNSVYNAHGCVLALSKKLYQQLSISKDIVSDDEFLYFSCIKKGLLFTFSKSSRVYYKIPTNLFDYIRQNKRYLITKHAIIAHFGSKAEQAYAIKLSDKLRGIVHSFLNKPLLTICAIVLQVSLRLFVISKPNIVKKGTWQRVSSTKV